MPSRVPPGRECPPTPAGVRGCAGHLVAVALDLRPQRSQVLLHPGAQLPGACSAQRRDLLVVKPDHSFRGRRPDPTPFRAVGVADGDSRHVGCDALLRSGGQGRVEPPTFRFSGVAYTEVALVVRVLCVVGDRCW